MEAWTRSLRRTATSRRRPGPGGTDRRKPSWPMAAQQQPSALPLVAKRLLQITRPDFRRGTTTCIIHRTAVYGPVRTVVWEGRSREAPPYPDPCDGFRMPANADLSTGTRAGVRKPPKNETAGSRAPGGSAGAMGNWLAPLSEHVPEDVAPAVDANETPKLKPGRMRRAARLRRNRADLEPW